MDEQTEIPLFSMLTEEFGLSEREIVAHLTPHLAEISRRIGLRATLIFLDYSHGRQIYIPESSKTRSSLVDVLGDDAAASIIEYLGGSRKFDVGNPFGDRFKRRMRALKALRGGASLDEVATRFGAGRSQVKKWKRDAGLNGVVKSERRATKRRPSTATRRKTASDFDVNAHMEKMCNARADRFSEQRKQAFEMFAAGRRLVDIQAAIGVSITTVKEWRKQYGART